ncbi:MAG: lysoplasmalogenase [Rhizobiaceae bacterium]
MSATAYGGYFTLQPSSALRTIIKTVSTLCLSLIALIGGGPILLIVALGFGALGDAFLSLRDEKGFLPGLGSFLIGHLCFVVLFMEMGQGFDLFFQDPWRIVAALFMIGFTLYMVQKLLPKLGALTIPVLLYMVVIFCMGIATLSLPLAWPTSLVMSGALFFIASDSILAHELFLIPKGSPILRITAPVLWFFYWGGQALIAAGVLL